MEQHEGDDDNGAVNNRIDRLDRWFGATDTGQIVERDEDANWILIGICLRHILAPALRNFVKPVIKNLYESLKNSNNIHTQSSHHLLNYPTPDGYKLHYENINNNENNRQFDYKVKDEIEFSKLFVLKQMSKYTDIDKTCDLSAILGLIINIRDFKGPLAKDAEKVRDEIRNRWAHPEDSSWADEIVDEYFVLIQQCIKSIQLLEKEESNILHQILELRFNGKKKLRSQTSINAMVKDLLEDDLYKRVLQGTCNKCKEVIKLQENRGDNDDSGSKDDKLSPEALNEQWVCLIKLYPWLKDEMETSHAHCIASQTLDKDQTEIVRLSKFRRMTVDALLKPVLRYRNVYLSKFLRSLRIHLKPSELQERFTRFQPTLNEIKECIVLNEYPTNRQISDENLCHMAEPDKTALSQNMKDVNIIDRVNDSFLARFYFSLGDHDSICDHLHKQELNNGAIRLFATMEKCSKEIMVYFCDKLESLQETSEMVQRMELRKKYCCEERQVKGFFATMLDRIVHLNAYAQQAFEFATDGIDFGSIIFRLRPQSLHSWGKLKQHCSSGNIINMLNEEYLDETILNSFDINENRLLITIYTETSVPSENTGQPTALLKMELISKNYSYAAAVASEEDPIRRHLEVFCEELEISDELIKLLELKELIPSHIKDQLKRAGSRSSEIRCLLESISDPKKGYEVLKEYLRYSNGYIHQLLVESDKRVPTRELVFQCEAQLKQKKGDAYSKSAEKSVPYIWVLINKKSYFGENEIPCLCLPPPIEPQVVNERNQNQSASDTKDAMPNQQWQPSTNATDGKDKETDAFLTLKDSRVSDFQSKGSSQYSFDSNKDLSSGGSLLAEFDLNKVEDGADSALEQEKASVSETENSHQHASDQKHPDLSMHILKSEAVQEPGDEASNCSIKVDGISKIAFRDTLELYFESPLKSGGGSIKYFDAHKEDDLAIVTFKDETVARRVLSRSHKLNNEVLSVSPYKPPKPRPAYENRLLIQGVDSSTRKEDLFNFLERGNGGVLASSLEYGEQNETVLVTFDSEIDFDELVGYCRTKPLRGKMLELSKVYKSNCVLVSHLRDPTTSESVKLYFENETRSNGGDVEKVKMLGKSGSCLVFFEDYTVVDNVLKKKHILEDQVLTVQIYEESLGRSQYATDDIVDELVKEVDTQLKIKSPRSFQSDNETETNGVKGGLRKESTKDPTHKCVTSESDEIRTEKQRQPLDLGFKRIYAVAKMYDIGRIYTAVGDMSQIKVGALMNSVDKNLSLAGGLGAVLARKGGDKVVKDCKEYVECQGNLSEGDVFISTGGNLQADYIVHVCCPQWQDGKQKEDEVLRQVIVKALRRISAKEVQSVAIPALGSGGYGFPLRKSSEIITLAVKDFFLKEQVSSLVNVYLVAVDSKRVDAFTDAATNVFDNVQRLPKQTDFGTDGYEIECHFSPSRSSSTRGKGASGEFGKIKIDVIKGDVASLTVDIIANTTARNLDLRSGTVSKSLLNLGGKIIQQELNTEYPNRLEDNEIAVSSGGCLKCKHILHGWLIDWDGGEKAISAIQNFMCNCLKTADRLRAISIAFPAIGTGQLKYPCDIVAKEMFSAVRRFERDHPMTTLREAMFVVFHKNLRTFEAFEMEKGKWPEQS